MSLSVFAIASSTFSMALSTVERISAIFFCSGRGGRGSLKFSMSDFLIDLKVDPEDKYLNNLLS